MALLVRLQQKLKKKMCVMAVPYLSTFSIYVIIGFDVGKCYDR